MFFDFSLIIIDKTIDRMNVGQHLPFFMKLLLPYISSVLIWTSSSLCAADGAWNTNFEAAKKDAVSEKKDLLLEFTGSDWCPPCKMLHETILTKDVFLNYAKEHFVLVELDFPKTKKLAPEVAKQNDELQKKMGVSGFPTVFLCDATGKPYATCGFARQSPEDYVANLGALRKVRGARDEAFAAADQAKGFAKAELLSKALQTMDAKIVDGNYFDVLQQIADLDPEKKISYCHERLAAAAAKKEKAATNELLGAFVKGTLQPMIKGGDVEGTQKAIDAFQEKNPSIPAQSIQSLKFNIIISHYIGADDEENAIAFIKKFAEANPTSSIAEDPDKVISSLKQLLAKKKEQAGQKKAE
jgi:thioredoxin-related protein